MQSSSVCPKLAFCLVTLVGWLNDHGLEAPVNVRVGGFGLEVGSWCWSCWVGELGKEWTLRKELKLIQAPIREPSSEAVRGSCVSGSQ